MIMVVQRARENLGRLVAGKYELMHKLGEGGMAEIYLARLTGAAQISKQVVLKRIRPALADDPEVVAMFLDEARLTVQLHHPNVAQVFEVVEDPAGYFLAMEYLQGSDAASILKALGGPLPVQEALELVVRACAGLHHAHELRDAGGRPLHIVHRDVSPSNLFITEDGMVKVLDFGIALGTDRVTRTSTGIVKGKVGYLSPELVLAQEVDRRSDVFALGVVLYELTLGRRPFDRPGDPELFILQRISESEYPSPSALDPRYPPALERIVSRALARDPDARFASADAMALAIESMAADSGYSLSSRSLRHLVRERAEVPNRDEPSMISDPWGHSGPAPVTHRADAGVGSIDAPRADEGERRSHSRIVVISLALIAIAAAAVLALVLSESLATDEGHTPAPPVQSEPGESAILAPQDPVETPASPAEVEASRESEEVQGESATVTATGSPAADDSPVLSAVPADSPDFSAAPAKETAKRATSSSTNRRRASRKRRSQRKKKAEASPSDRDDPAESWTRDSAFPPRVP